MHTNRVAQWIAHQTSNLGGCGFESRRGYGRDRVHTQVSQKQLDNASGWFSEGFEALVTLWIAIISAEERLIRGVAAGLRREDRPRHAHRLRRGRLHDLPADAVLWHHGYDRLCERSGNYDNFMKLGYLSIFDLIRNLPQFWHYVTSHIIDDLSGVVH